MPTTKTNLYRALKKDEYPGEFQVDEKPVGGLLYPRFESTTYTDRDGVEQVSQADVDIVRNPVTKVLEVQTGGGTSLFDVIGWFGNAYWKYFQIPDGTEYPNGLFIKKGRSKRINKTKTATGYHYQIEPKIPMTVDTFKGYLDLFARNAVVRSNELAKSKT